MADVALPKTNQTGTNEWADVQDNDDRLLGVINKDYDSPLAEVVGMSIDSGSTRRDYAEVLTEETTATTTWTDLASAGPSVTITVPSNMLVLIGISIELKNSAGNAYVGVYEGTDRAISGAPSSTEYMPGGPGYAQTTTATYQDNPYMLMAPITATAGSRTYTLKYCVSASTGTFKNRAIWAMALGGF